MSDSQRSALLWLQDVGVLKAVLREMRARGNMPHPPPVLRMRVPIDIMELGRYSSELVDTVVWRPLEAERLFQSLVHAACVACALNMRALANESLLNATDSTASEGHTRQGDMNSLSAPFNSTNENFRTISAASGWFSAGGQMGDGNEHVMGSATGSAVDLSTSCGRSASNAPNTSVGYCTTSNGANSNFDSSTIIGLGAGYDPNNSHVFESRLVPVAGSLVFGMYSRHVPHDEAHGVGLGEPTFGLLTPHIRDQHSGPESLYSEEMNKNISNKDCDQEDIWNKSKRQKTESLSDNISETASENLFEGEFDLNETVVDKEDLNATLISLASDRPIENEAPDILTSAQVLVRLRVSGLPQVAPWRVSSLPEVSHPPGCLRMAVIVGRVTAITAPPRPYTVWARYRCRGSDPCVGRTRDLHIRVRAFGALEADTVQCQRTCRVCGGALVEDQAAREIGEQVGDSSYLRLEVSIMVHLKPESPPNSLPPLQQGPLVLRPVTITLRDDLCRHAVLGRLVTVTVLAVPRLPPHYPHLEALHIHQQEGSTCSSTTAVAGPQLRMGGGLGVTDLPEEVRALYMDRASSPWSAALSLAYMVGSSVAAAGSFHTLKLALLLSLVSPKTDDEAGLSVLSVGSNMSPQMRLQQHLSRAAPHRVLHGPQCNLTPARIQGAAGEQRCWVSAGSVVGGSGGVCVLGDLTCCRRDTRATLARVLESGRCSVESRGGQSALEVPLRTRVWGCYQPGLLRGKAAGGGLADGESLLMDADKALADLFGLVVYCDNPGDEADSSLVLQTLLHATQPQHHIPADDLLPLQHLAQVVRVCCHLPVSVSSAARRLLSGYYVAMRRLRGDGVRGPPLPLTSLRTLLSVCSSHARLSLRGEAQESDAAAAVLLCEEALAAITGYSVLQVVPRPHLPYGASLDNTIGRKNDEYMTAFLHQLEDLVAAQTGTRS